MNTTEAKGFHIKYSDGTLTQQRIQLLRIVHMLEDYSLHKVLTRRYHASKNPISLNGHYVAIFQNYCSYLEGSELSASTVAHYKSISIVFMDYLTQLNVDDTGSISMETCNGYLKTQAGYSFKTVELNVCGIRHFLRYLFSAGMVADDFAGKIHMTPVSKSAKIPFAWTADELKRMIAAIDRDSPIVKRDYAMIVLACVLGLRIGDIKNLCFTNIDWNEKKYHSSSTRRISH